MSFAAISRHKVVFENLFALLPKSAPNPLKPYKQNTKKSFVMALCKNWCLMFFVSIVEICKKKMKSLQLNSICQLKYTLRLLHAKPFLYCRHGKKRFVQKRTENEWIWFVVYKLHLLKPHWDLHFKFNKSERDRQWERVRWTWNECEQRSLIFY